MDWTRFFQMRDAARDVGPSGIEIKLEKRLLEGFVRDHAATKTLAEMVALSGWSEGAIRAALPKGAKPYARKSRLSPEDLRATIKAWNETGTVGGVASALGIWPGTATNRLRRLAEDGLVEFEARPSGGPNNHAIGPEDEARFKAMIEAGEHTVREIAKAFNTSRLTVYKTAERLHVEIKPSGISDAQILTKVNRALDDGADTEQAVQRAIAAFKTGTVGLRRARSLVRAAQAVRAGQ
jgi:predicted transcriptional regulator